MDTNKPDEKESDEAIELAGELALAWCVAQVEEVAALFPLRDGTDRFRAGFSTACEELKERFKTQRFSAILGIVTDGIAKRTALAPLDIDALCALDPLDPEGQKKIRADLRAWVEESS